MTREARLLLLVLLFSTAIRIGLAVATGLGDSEAYYTAWSLDLQASYYDHPPGVAALIAATTAIVGLSPLGVRLGPILLIDLCALLLFVVSKRAGFSPRAALWAALLLLATPVFAIGGMTASPDMPLAALWLSGLLVAHMLLVEERSELRWWLLCGAILGLAFLTKYTAILMVVGFVVAARRLHHPIGRNPRFWLAGGVALLLALPVIVWNLQHEMASLAYHAVERHQDIPFHPKNAAALLGGQIGYFSPVIFALFVWAWRDLRKQETPCRSEVMLGAFAAPVLVPLYVLCLATSEAEPHWPAMGYLALYVLAGVTLERAAQRARRRWLGWALGMGVALQAVFFVHATTPLIVEQMPESYEPRYDIVNELYGWDTVLEELTLRADATLGDRAYRLAAMHYVMCGQLAVWTGDLQRVACPSPKRDAFDDLTEPVQGGEWLLFVSDNRYTDGVEEHVRCAEQRALGEAVVVLRGERAVRRFEGTLCRVSAR